MRRTLAIVTNGLTPNHHDHIPGVSGFDLDVEAQLDDDCLLLLSEGEKGESDCDDSQTESDSDYKTDIDNALVNSTNTYLCSYVCQCDQSPH